MSTMYYTYPDKKQVGQTHSKGKGRGYHFTWCMYPMELVDFCLEQPTQFITEYGQVMPFLQFQEVIHRASSQSFDERIE